jgi:hypothetical protein
MYVLKTIVVMVNQGINRIQPLVVHLTNRHLNHWHLIVVLSPVAWPEPLLKQATCQLSRFRGQPMMVLDRVVVGRPIHTQWPYLLAHDPWQHPIGDLIWTPTHVWVRSLWWLGVRGWDLVPRGDHGYWLHVQLVDIIFKQLRQDRDEE